MRIYIGQAHNCVVEPDREEFDMVYCAKSEEGVVAKVKSHMADWCDNLEMLEERDLVMACKNADELAKWFDNHFATFSFQIATEEI